MKTKEELAEIQKKLEESAKKIFKDKPDDIKKELEKETTLGSPDNLFKPDNKDE